MKYIGSFIYFHFEFLQYFLNNLTVTFLIMPKAIVYIVHGFYLYGLRNQIEKL